MKLLYKEDGEVGLVLERLEDLWHLEKILSEGDLVEAKSWRVFRVGSKEEKKPVTIRIKVEKATFSAYSNSLRVLGTIVWGVPEEYVPLGRHHSLDIGCGSRIKVIKEKWFRHHLKRIREAEKSARESRAVVVLIDEEKALFAHVSAIGISFGPEVRSFYSKRAEYDERDFFGRVLEELKRHQCVKIVAGPGFVKERFASFAKDNGVAVYVENASTTERSGVFEIIKRVEEIIGEVRTLKELNTVEIVIREIVKEGAATYGKNEVLKAAEIGAVKLLVVLDELVRRDKEVESIIDTVEKNGGEVLMVGSDNEAGQKLKGFGGIAALLRFKASI